jgi:abhydrolase domain-containing protein 8
VWRSHEVIAFDWFGCGRSPKPNQWYAYGYETLRADLAAVVASYGSNVAGQKKKNVLVAHSAGCSLSLAVVAAVRAQPSVTIDGLCLLGALCAAIKPHPVFYLPVVLLNLLQPKLSAGFEALALHEHTRQATTEEHRRVLALAASVNASNPMHMCKAYYRQYGAPTPDEVRQAGELVKSICLVVGENDQLVPLAGTEALKALLPADTPLHVIPRTSHQMMQEDPGMCSEWHAATPHARRGVEAQSRETAVIAANLPRVDHLCRSCCHRRLSAWRAGLR